MYGLSRLPDEIGYALIAAGVVGCIGFVRWENACTHPLLQMSLFRRNPVFTYSNLAALVNYSATFAVDSC